MRGNEAIGRIAANNSWLMAAGFLCWLAAVVLAAILDPGAHDIILLTAVVGGAMLFQPADTIDLWFQSQTQSRRTVSAKLAAYILTNGLKGVLILNHAPFVAFAAAFLFDVAAAALALGFAYRRFPTAQPRAFDLERAKSLVRRSWPFHCVLPRGLAQRGAIATRFAEMSDRAYGTQL